MPRAFSFPLQKVLDVRQHVEDQRAIELGQAKQELFKEQQLLNHLQMLKEKALNISEEELTQALHLSKIQMLESYLIQLNEKIDVQKKLIKTKKSEVNKKRRELLKASQEKKIVEKLKERQLEVHRKSVRLQENKIIDEVALRVTQRNG